MATGPDAALLRTIVGPGPSEEALRTAWRRARGDLAAAVNIILDAAQQPSPAPPPGAPAWGALAAADGGPISLDDSDDGQPAAAGPPPPREPGPPGPSQVGGPVAVKTEPAERAADATAAPSAPARPFVLPQPRPAPAKQARAGKRAKVEAPSLETPPKEPPPRPPGAQACDWSFPLGSIEFDAYSTTRVGLERTLEEGPLLKAGARLGLRWDVQTKKRRGRPGGDAGAPNEGGLIRFDAGSVEVGRFPTAQGRMLVPLLTRELVQVEARVGADPPHILELGTNIPLVVDVTVRAAAFGPVGKAPEAPSGRAAGQGGTGADQAPGSKRKSRDKAAVLKDAEVNQEVRRNATAQLLEQLRLPRLRSAVAPADEPGGAGAGADAGADTGGPVGLGGGGAEGGEAPDEDAEAQEDMSREAAAQLGGRHALERGGLPAVRLSGAHFGAELRHYQAQAVYWMWQRENPTSRLPPGWLQDDDASAASACGSTPAPGAADGDQRPLHPMWDEYELGAPVGPLPGRPEEAPLRLVYHHRTTGALSLDFPDAALAHCRGGVLADDMGLGKTVMCLALLSLDFPQDLPSARSAAPSLRALEGAQQELSTSSRPSGDAGMGGTLVVMPVSLVTQWHEEVKRHFPAGIRPTVHEYHGSGRNGMSPQHLCAFGVVLTTYGTLSAEKEDGALFQIFWTRVILDEAHSIKNRNSRVAQAAFRLNASCRWCITGTPLQNCVDELYALVRFLRVDPWSSWPEWRRAVTLLLERGRQGDARAMSEALDAARRIVQPMLLRRTKMTTDRATGELLLKLPQKHVTVLQLELSAAERDFYDALYTKAKMQFDTFLAQGDALSKYTHILQLILKLRQALCHPFLVFARDAAAGGGDLGSLEKRCLREMSGEKGASDKFVGNLLEELRKGELPDCPICCDAPVDPAMTPCGHIFCRECALQAISEWNAECPVCRRTGALHRKNLKVLPGASRFPSRLLEKSAAEGGGEAAHSTKMKELLALLREDMAAGRRAVAFSQWTSFLDLVQNSLEAAGIPWQRYDGSLNREQRQQRVTWLGDGAGTGDAGASGGGRVLLVSLKAGGTGLNLVAATRLYLLDLWWNPAVEEQAIQRVHRIGQTSEVHVYKFIVRDSIDEGLLALQKAKVALLDDAMEGGGSRQASMKLTMEDLKNLFNPCRSVQSALRTFQAGGAAEAAAPHGGGPAAAPPSPPPSPPLEAAAAPGAQAAGGPAAAPSPPALPPPWESVAALSAEAAAPNGSGPAAAPLSPPPSPPLEAPAAPGAQAAGGPAASPSPPVLPPPWESPAALSAEAPGAALAPLRAAPTHTPPVPAPPAPREAPVAASIEAVAPPEAWGDSQETEPGEPPMLSAAEEAEILGAAPAAGPRAPQPPLAQPWQPAATSAAGPPGAAGGREATLQLPASAGGAASPEGDGGVAAVRDRSEAGGSEQLSQDLDACYLGAGAAEDAATAPPAAAPPVVDPATAGALAAAPQACSGAVEGDVFDSDSDADLLAACEAYESQLAGVFASQVGAPPPPLFAAVPPADGIGAPQQLPPPAPEWEAPATQAQLGPDPLCRCVPPRPATMLTVRKEGPNTGRQFYKCGDCDFFQWADEAEGPRRPLATAPRADGFGAQAPQAPAHRPEAEFGTEALCRCDPPRPAALLTVRKEGPNTGRQFYKCGDCNFFQWADEPPGGAGGAASSSGPYGGGPVGRGGGFGSGPGAGGSASGGPPPAAGGGASNACFKCGQTGHWARDCPAGAGAAAPRAGGGGAGGGGGECFKCGQPGHWARDCPNVGERGDPRSQFGGSRGGPRISRGLGRGRLR